LWKFYATFFRKNIFLFAFNMYFKPALHQIGPEFERRVYIGAYGLFGLERLPTLLFSCAFSTAVAKIWLGRVRKKQTGRPFSNTQRLICQRLTNAEKAFYFLCKENLSGLNRRGFAF